MAESIPGKNKAILAYATFVGFLIAASMNSNEKDAFATWHLKNMFGIIILWIISLAAQFNMNLLTGDMLQIASIVFVMYSLIMAIQGKKKGIPFLSEKFQQWFTFLD
ncbi:MAG: hypothetical protein ACKVGT_09250 [Flavobacteriales bacterium]|jgi:hypothetical protein|tara:strand:- start:642 stop:962 length:321 start_codon:yes stop_codon:yes gene_type:complete